MTFCSPTKTVFLYLLAIIGLYGSSVDAQESPIWAERTELYRGVIPGERDRVSSSTSHAEGGPNEITWIGFQPEAQRSRVFLQTSQADEYYLAQDHGRDGLVIVIENTGIPQRNFERFIDASHFGRAVDRIVASQTSGGGRGGVDHAS